MPTEPRPDPEPDDDLATQLARRLDETFADLIARHCGEVAR